MFRYPTKDYIDIPETSSIIANNRINYMENIQTNTKQAHEVAKNLINQRIKSKLSDLKIGTQVWLDSLSQMVTYLICDLRKEFFKRVQARFR